ncbi:hypothetical protein D1BOALGB6SA_1718 [Olavius sp. associated proteobacterium Delta 1]|nr:hypothetical protein D1BOALGB6SA_1718 [Olavius sp. associated proteobacterium Delta 1]
MIRCYSNFYLSHERVHQVSYCKIAILQFNKTSLAFYGT